MSKYIPDKEFSVTISATSEIIPNIYELEKIGAGHDGYIYRFHDYALKILKYDIKLRKKRGLMTFEKATYFRNHLNLQRITQPIDVLLDEDGVYTGYVMRYVDDLTSVKKKGTPQYRNPGDYSCGDLVYSWEVLADDFQQLSDNGIRVKDINRGSYLFASDFMYLCDTDKYTLHSSSEEINKSKLNFAIAKFLVSEMKKTGDYDKEHKRIFDSWVKKSSNSKTFRDEILSDIGSDYNVPISKYVDYKVKTLLR